MIQYIDKLDFIKIEGSRQVIAHDYARKFAVIDLGNSLGCYGLSWRSTLVEPIIELSPDKQMIWLGVDQQLAAISLHQGKICASLTLNTNILQILNVDKLIAVLTEDEVLLFNPDSSIRLIKGLPSLAEDIFVTNTNLVIRLLEGGSLTLDPQIGTLKPLEPKLSQ